MLIIIKNRLMDNRWKNKVYVLLRSMLFVLLIVSILPSFGQKNSTEKVLIDSINQLAFTIGYGENDIVKLNANELLIETLYNTLIQKESKGMAFDSLKNIAFLAPSDKAFRLFTWIIKKEDGTYECFGVLQTVNPKNDRSVIFTLKDKSNLFYAPEVQIGEVDNWFGAVYYKVITTVINRKKYYTLLGWNGCNQFKQRKVIEVLSFRANGTPVFGSKIFKKYQDKNPVRIVFEYYKGASMTLIYDKQSYKMNTGKRDPKTKRVITKEVITDMIVFDRLAPLNENLVNVKEYYVPETNVLDAFVPVSGRWQFVGDIEARNQPKKTEKGAKVEVKSRELYKKPSKKKPK